MQVEINDRLLRMIRQLAEDQDRPPTEVVEEALSRECRSRPAD